MKLKFYTAMRWLTQVFWPHPPLWLYWDEKVLAARKDAKKRA